MKLEKEIEQSSFANEGHKLIVNMIYTHNWMVTRIKALLKEHDLTMQQFNILRILRGQHPKPATINLLRERMLDKMSDASRIVERLRIKGYISRTPSEKDRRAVEVVITQKGLDLLKEIDDKNSEFDKLLEHLDESEAKTMNKLLDKMRGPKR